LLTLNVPLGAVTWQGSPVHPGRGDPTIRKGPTVSIVLVR